MGGGGEKWAYHGVLDVGVDACLLGVDADLDGVVDGAARGQLVCASGMVGCAHRLTGTRMLRRRAGEGRMAAATSWCWSESREFFRRPKPAVFHVMTTQRQLDIYLYIIIVLVVPK